MLFGCNTKEQEYILTKLTMYDADGANTGEMLYDDYKNVIKNTLIVACEGYKVSITTFVPVYAQSTNITRETIASSVLKGENVTVEEFEGTILYMYNSDDLVYCSQIEEDGTMVCSYVSEDGTQIYQSERFNTNDELFADNVIHNTSAASATSNNFSIEDMDSEKLNTINSVIINLEYSYKQPAYDDTTTLFNTAFDRFITYYLL